MKVEQLEFGGQLHRRPVHHRRMLVRDQDAGGRQRDQANQRNKVLLFPGFSYIQSCNCVHF
jgi:hypothetical protein